MNKAGEISINWGDVIFTFLAIGMPVLIIILAIFFLRSKKRLQKKNRT